MQSGFLDSILSSSIRSSIPTSNVNPILRHAAVGSDNHSIGPRLDAALVRAVRDEGYEHPTPIQVGAILTVALGKDFARLRANGTGKTGAFALSALAASFSVAPSDHFLRLRTLV